MTALWIALFVAVGHTTLSRENDVKFMEKDAGYHAVASVPNS